MTDRYGHPRQSIFQPGRRHASATASVAYSTSQQHQQQHPSSQAPPAAPVKPPRQVRFRSQITTARRHLAPAAGRRAAVDSDGDTLLVEEDDYDDDEDEEGEGEGEGDEDGGDEGIVVRDADGEYEVEEPPSMVVDDPDEIVLDLRQENESKC